MEPPHRHRWGIFSLASISPRNSRPSMQANNVLNLAWSICQNRASQAKVERVGQNDSSHGISRFPALDALVGMEAECVGVGRRRKVARITSVSSG